jgi:adenylate kinase
MLLRKNSQFLVRRIAKSLKFATRAKPLVRSFSSTKSLCDNIVTELSPPEIPITSPTIDKTLEVKDANLIFTQVLRTLEEKHGKHNLCFPKEIIFLAGAPGAGKGSVTPHILEIRGLTSEPIVCSDLLESPEMIEMKRRGELISDRTVVELVFNKLLDSQYQSGVIVDGFPRTRIQAECIAILYEQMSLWRNEYKKTMYQFKYPRPVFHILVLFCDEKTSVQRQLYRGSQALKTNLMFEEIGDDDMKVEQRSTDFSEEIAKKRYKFFKETIFESLKLLKKKFHYHFIDANVPIDDVMKNVEKELSYQSTLELSNETFEKVSKIPSSDEIILNARYQLIRRLDSYTVTNPDLLEGVIETIRTEFLHILQRQAFSGVSVIRSQNKIFENPLAVNMILDIMTERGYEISLDVEKRKTPVSMDPTTFKFFYDHEKIFHFIIHFVKPIIRK